MFPDENQIRNTTATDTLTSDPVQDCCCYTFIEAAAVPQKSKENDPHSCGEERTAVNFGWTYYIRSTYQVAVPMLFLLRQRWEVLDKLLLLLLLAPASAIEPQTSNSGATVDGGILSVTSWHAQTLTNVSWEIPLVDQDDSNIIVFTWDEVATEEAWWPTENASRAVSPPSTTAPTPSPTLPPFVGQSDDPIPQCAFRTRSFDSQSKGAFNTEAARQHVSVDLVDNRTWWYTATLSQEMPNTTSLTSGVGQASILLSEPGFYTACLLREVVDSSEACQEQECIDFTVYQPPNDFLEVGGKANSLTCSP